MTHTEPTSIDGGHLRRVPLQVRDVREHTIVQIELNTLADPADIEDLGRQVSWLIEEGSRRRIILDFSRVEFISSQMIGTLVELHRKCKGVGGELSFVSLDPKLIQLFKITKLHKLFTIHDTLESAVLGKPKSTGGLGGLGGLLGRKG